MPRRLMYVQPETKKSGKAACQVEGWSGKGRNCAGIKELVGKIH
jgi:hypothetical protein